jgi:cytochrome P450
MLDAVRGLEQRKEEIADEIIHKLKCNRSLDLQSHSAVKYPARIIAQMLEVPDELTPSLKRRASRSSPATNVSRFPGISSWRQIRAFARFMTSFGVLSPFVAKVLQTACSLK